MLEFRFFPALWIRMSKIGDNESFKKIAFNLLYGFNNGLSMFNKYYK